MTQEQMAFSFDTKVESEYYLLTNGEELTKTLERGYADLCANNCILATSFPSQRLVDEVTNSRSAGYPVLIGLSNIGTRIVPIPEIRIIYFREERNLISQKQAIAPMHSVSVMNTSVEKQVFEGECNIPTTPPLGDDAFLGRLERLSSGVFAVVLSRKSSSIGGEFINSILKDAPTSISLVNIISNHRYGRDQEAHPLDLFIDAISEQMLEIDGDTLGSMQMIEIVEDTFRKIGITDPVSYAVLDELQSFTGLLGGKISEARLFTPIPDRVDSTPLADVYAIVNLIVMRPKLADLLDWPHIEHQAREDQYMAAAYILGLTTERRLQPAFMRPISLDKVLVRAIAKGLEEESSHLPSTSQLVQLGTRATGGLSINDESVKRVGPTWKLPQPANKQENQQFDKEIDNQPELVTLISELSSWLSAGSVILDQLQQLVAIRDDSTLLPPAKKESSAKEAKKKQTARRAKVGSLARPQEEDQNDQ